MTTATKTFDYHSIDTHGKQTKGKVDAPSEAVAAQVLRQQGIIALTISESGTGLKRDISIPGL
ncbi:MAG: type pilus assembly protein PilC, partial [Micromonosporaceae bacterium]|nr:type pilus assembly protein PilC [Micromonosporaceae bacterium]